jgi:hypothetical protein
MGLYDDNPGTTAAPTGAPPGAAPPSRLYEDDPGKPERSGDKVRQLISEQSKMSWPAWLNQGAGDFTAAAADMASFGTRPRLDAATGALTGTYPDYGAGLAKELQTSRERHERSPIASAVGEAGGAVAGGVAGAIPKIGSKIATTLAPSLGPRLASILGFGTEAGGIGAAQAVGNTYTGNPEDYMSAAMWGGGTGLGLGMAGGALVPASRVAPRPGDPATRQPIRPPTNEELLARSDNGYQVLSQIPVTYPGSHLQGALSNAESRMITQNVAPEQAQTVQRIIDRVRNHPGSISPAQIDGIRQSLNNMKNGQTPGSEKAGVAAGILRDSLDDMIQNGAQAASNPVLAQQAAQWVQQARGDRAAMFRSRQLTEPVANAELKQQTGGPLVGEQLVGEGNKLLKVKGGQQPNTRGWNDEERAALAAAITPTLPERAANLVGASGGKVATGVGALLGASGGGVAGVPAGPAAAIAGATGGGIAGGAAGAALGSGIARAARGFSAGGIADRWNDVASTLRQRSPSYERAIQGSVPIAGPGMKPIYKAGINAATVEAGVPSGYDDRDALAQQLMRQFSY